MRASLELMADFRHSLHVGLEFHAEFLAEYVHKLDRRSCGAASEPLSDVGVDVMSTPWMIAVSTDARP